MTPSPAPSIPGLSLHSSALQPGSMVQPGMPSGVSTPIGAGGAMGDSYMSAKGQAASNDADRSAVEQMANMSMSDHKNNAPGGSSSSGQVSSSQSVGNTGNASNKGPDYVYFARNPQQYSSHTLQKSTATKMRMELYYKQAVEGVVQRKERRVALEKSLMNEGGRGMEDWQKAKQLQSLGKRETKYVFACRLLVVSSAIDGTSLHFSFLRLRRTKIGLEDFRTVKVIGKGAFGEVSILCRVPHVILGKMCLMWHHHMTGSALPKD